MESEKDLSSSFEEKQDTEKVKIAKNFERVENKNINRSGSEHEARIKAKHFKSMIPIMKNEKIETKTFIPKKRPDSSSKSLTESKTDIQKDFDNKLKALKEKEKSIAEYYLRIEEMIQKSKTQERDDENKKLSNCKISEDSSAKKMISDPSGLSKNRIKSEMADFENNIQQISHIWLKTTSDLSSTLKNLKTCSRVDPIELQMENIRIQLAIKQAKSLTLVKTRSVIAEAKKLFQNREIIRSELECLLNQENLKIKSENRQRELQEKDNIFSQQNTEEQAIHGTGDSLKDIDADSLEDIKETIFEKYSKKKKSERVEKEASMRPLREDNFLGENETFSDKVAKEQIKPDSCYDSAKIVLEVENLKKELCRKNKTITKLNKKIFDLQKTCNENSAKYNQLQNKLFEFHEKIQWNQVLWKQIGKLKERIKSLQENNRELEFQKKELESKLIGQDQEIDRLIKLNNILNRKKHLLDVKEITVAECTGGKHELGESHGEIIRGKYFNKTGGKACVVERVISEKQTAINQLKKILNIMKHQENFAQKQISMFQSRIEELEKNGKA